MTIVNGWVVELEVVVELWASASLFADQSFAAGKPARTRFEVALKLVSLNLAPTARSITKTIRSMLIELNDAYSE